MADLKPWEENYSTEDVKPWEEDYDSPSLTDEALNTTNALVQGVGKGASFGFTDELSGALSVGVDTAAGLANKVNPEWGYEDTKSIPESYTEGRDFARKQYEELAKENPITTTVGEIGGAISGGIAGLGGKLATKVGLTGAKNVLAAGTLEGGLYGLGESNKDNIKDMAMDTAIGAGLGLATSGLIEGAGKLFKTKKMAEEGAGRLLETTPVDRTKLANKGITLPDGTKSNVYTNLPDYIKSKGFKGNLEHLAGEVDKDSKAAGKRISEIAELYDTFISKVKGDILEKRTALHSGSGDFQSIVKRTGNILEENAYDFAKMANKLESDFVPKIKGVPGLEGNLNQVEEYIKKLRELGKVDTLSELNRQRRGIDSMLYDKAAPVSNVMKDVFKTVRKDITGHVTDKMLPAFDEVISNYEKNLGVKAASRFKNVTSDLLSSNAEYTMASAVNDLLEKAPARRANRRDFGLTDQIWGIGGVGSAVAAGSPLPLLLPVGKKILDYAAPRAKLYAPEIGNALSKVATPLSKIGIQQTASKFIGGESPQETPDAITENTNGVFEGDIGPNQELSQNAPDDYSNLLEMFSPEEIKNLEDLSPTVKNYAPDEPDYISGGKKGSLIEGAAYGLGQKVSEHNLGDPEYLAEALASGTFSKDVNLSDYNRGIATPSDRQYLNHPQTVKYLTQMERQVESVKSNIEYHSSQLTSPTQKSVVPFTSSSGISRQFGKDREANQRITQKRMENVQALVGDPDHFMDKLDEHTHELYKHAPETAQHLSNKSVETANFLSTKIPSHDRDPLESKWEYSQAEMSSFNRYYEAVKDPYVVLKQASAGTLTPEAVEAVSTVYPKLYEKMQEELMSKLMDRNVDKIPYRKKMMLSMLMQRNLDGSLEPTNFKLAQDSHNAILSQNGNSPIKTTLGGAKELSLGERTETQFNSNTKKV